MTRARGQAEAEQQIAAVLTLIDAVLGTDALGVYLYGSSIVGGLQKHSDIDVLTVSARPTTRGEKQWLVEQLLTIASVSLHTLLRPIELTIVVQSEIRPWQYPPRFDFLYGDWMRQDFEAGNVEPWATAVYPDLAIVLTQVLIASKALVGPPASTLVDPVPHRDFMTAMVGEIDRLMGDLEADTRNVLLTLARIWCTVETDSIQSKPDAAAWALQRLPTEHQPALARARASCLGEVEDHWRDIKPLIHPCADFMIAHVKGQMTQMDVTDEGRSIRLLES